MFFQIYLVDFDVTRFLFMKLNVFKKSLLLGAVVVSAMKKGSALVPSRR